MKPRCEKGIFSFFYQYLGRFCRHSLPIVTASLICFPSVAADGGVTPRPNVLLILIDDLGYTDIGAYGGKASTPNIDRIAHAGIRFSDAHVYPSCAPTRAALLTGQDPHRVGLGSQNGNAPPGVSLDTPGYKGSLEGEFVGIASLLNDSGYQTFMSGKWHLGDDHGQLPEDLGFDRYFALMDGAASHYGDRLAVSTNVSPGGKVTYRTENGVVDSLPGDFFSSAEYAEQLIEMLKEKSESPFFAYLSFTAVHDPLHAPHSIIEEYDEVYSEGYEKLRSSRIQRLQKEGLFPGKSDQPPWHASVPRWESLTSRQKLDMNKRMAVYSAMLDDLDRQAGKVLNFLEEKDLLDSTLVVIMSDNGAAPIPSTFYSLSESDHAWLKANYGDRQIEHYGREGTFPTMGLPNAQAVTGPYNGFKVTLLEGGTRVPMIIYHPALLQKTIRHDFVHVTDLYPTFADLAGIDVSEANLFGHSLLPLLKGESQAHVRMELGAEFLGQRSLRLGQWKLVFIPEPFGGTGQYALYDLENDPGETRDLAQLYPRMVTQLSNRWDSYAKENGVVPADIDAVNAVSERVAKRMLGIDWGE